MKFYSKQIDSFLSGLDRSGIFTALVYGPDIGGVSNIASKISAKIVADPSDPFSTTILDSEKLSNEPTILYDEMSALSFFGGRKLIQLKNADADAADTIKSLIANLPSSAKQGAFLLVTAGDLTPASALRKLYESNNNSIAVIPCYVEDEKDLSLKINRLLAERKIKTTERGIIEYLAESCYGDSKVIESEIEKIDLYLGQKRELSLEDVYATTGNFSETEIQDICDLICEGKKTEAQIALNRAMLSAIAPIAIIRTLQRYLEKLETSANKVREGEPIEKALPNLFFKQVPTFKNHLNFVLKKPANDIWKAYEVLYNAEAELKETGAEPELITSIALNKIF
jgi:DNA polymerase-3 subunit delta